MGECRVRGLRKGREERIAVSGRGADDVRDDHPAGPETRCEEAEEFLRHDVRGDREGLVHVECDDIVCLLRGSQKPAAVRRVDGEVHARGEAKEGRGESRKFRVDLDGIRHGGGVPFTEDAGEREGPTAEDCDPFPL